MELKLEEAIKTIIKNISDSRDINQYKKSDSTDSKERSKFTGVTPD